MAGCTEIAQRLGGVFGSQCSTGFKLEDEAVFPKQISEVIAEDRAVLISNLQGFLSLDSEANFSQTMGHPVFVNLLQMPISEIAVQLFDHTTPECVAHLSF